jgi:hypothetical protein
VFDVLTRSEFAEHAFIQHVLDAAVHENEPPWDPSCDDRLIAYSVPSAIRN